MATLIQKIFDQMLFWMAWIIIPLSLEIMPAIGGFVILVIKKIRRRDDSDPILYPEITLIIPVYNSSETLDGCLKSVYNSDYPTDRIHIMLVDNQSTDNSFQIFCDSQLKYPNLSAQWLKARQGKSRALNMALFNSNGKYIIHIDSDGKLEPSALKNMVERFEGDKNIHCLTGAVLTDPSLIEETDGKFMKTFRRCEFYEYCQAFLAGRNFESEINSIYTLSGAFSAFRKSTILKTQMYNTDTVCEDTHVTFQVRRIMKKGVHLCENALFFVDPIENLDKIYTQRQRWQTGELEVSHMFLKRELKTKGFFSNFMIRLLTFDHTFAFPRMIWYFALICLAFMNYPFKLIAGSVIILYILYVISGFLYFLNVYSYLSEYKELRKYYRRHWPILFLMPAFNMYGFWIRFAGIINSIKSRGTWKTSTFTEEKKRFSAVIEKDFRVFKKFIDLLKRLINKTPIIGEEYEKDKSKR